MKNGILKWVFLSLRILLTAGILALAIWLLWRYEYFSQFAAVDNIVGMLPVALVLLFAGGAVVLLWMKHSKRLMGLSVSLAIVVLLSAALFPNSLRGNWWIAPKLDLQPENFDLTPYAPFTGEKTARLDGEAEITFTEDLPVMDGALALYPVYAAVAEAVYDRTAYGEGESTPFTNTLRAFDNLIAGERDVIFSSHASEKQMQAAKQAGVELVHTPIGKEAFVFLVGDENPTEGLTRQQIYNIYSGKTAFWRTLGWEEGGPIVAFRRPEGSGSETGIQSVMKAAKLPLIAVQPVPDKSILVSDSLMDQISVEWRGVQPVLGYSYRFFATTMHPNPHAKLLQIDGVAPDPENIASGTYPFTVEFYAITRGAPTGNTARLIEWILSPEGQELIERTGYSKLH